MTTNLFNSLHNNLHNHNQKQKNKNFNNIEIIYNQPHKRSLDEMISTDEDPRVPLNINTINNTNNNNINNQHGNSQQIRSTSSSRSNSPLLIDDIQSPAISSPTIVSSPASSSSSSSLSAVFGSNKFSFSSQSINNSSNNNNSLSPIQKLDTIISNLREMCKKIDKCSPSARSLVWGEFADLSIRDSFGSDISDLALPDIPLFDCHSTAKITPFLNTLINEQTPHFHALQMLNSAFITAQQKNFNLFKEFSPQTSNQEDDSTVPSNPYLIPQLTTSNLWGISFQSVVQQLALLDYWSSQLDSLPSPSRKQLWDVCNGLPLFKSTFGNQKQEKFSKIIKLWIENPIQNMPLITTLFGAIGYLVEYKVINNNFCYPTSNTKVFVSSNMSKNDDYSSTSTTPIPNGRKKSKKHSSNSTVSALTALHGVDGEIPSMSPISNSSPQISFDDQSDSEDDSINTSATNIHTHNNNNKTTTTTTTTTTTNISNNHQINGVLHIVKSSPFSSSRPRSFSYNSISNINHNSTTDCINISRINNNNTTNNSSNVESLVAVSSLDALAMTATQFEELEDQKSSPLSTTNAPTDQTNSSCQSTFQSLSDPPEVPSSMANHDNDENNNGRIKKRRFSCSDVKTSVMNINNIICS